LTIKTLFANAKVEGTEFLVRVAPSQTSVSVFDGKILVSNALGSVRLVNGEAAIAEADRPPRREILMKPRDAVQWALYYPPLIDTRLAPTGPNAEALREALRLYRSGQIMQAVGPLDKVDAKQRDALYHDLRAGLLLSVGRVEFARADIAAARKLNPQDGTALALESIIAITQNDKTEALRLTQQAIIAEPNSPVPHVARSYAEQATFNLDKALESARTATRLAPENALAWARVAELELAQGDMDEAEEAAEKSRTLDPQLARTQTIAGFAALTRIDISKAKSAFTEAIARDPADPLPRLGLGLAKIRRGQLEDGRRDIENAANLDPNNALVRSYLGKAYYEEKRDKVAGVELDNAKLLDPKDPTPYFYDAIRKQTENRPVEALHDLQKSIELNDNRAVYRSKLQVEGDRAMRGTSLARLYDDLGFQRRGLLESTKSLAIDPGDYSAHRFLSDTYAH
ncbi:MAG: tetratricopeptide repeat protein, partial [Burkholderiales bacterium]